MEPPSPDPECPRKSLLICATCGHRSPPQGDWRLRRLSKTTVFECPCCGDELTRRPPERPTPVFTPLGAATPAKMTSLWFDYVRDVQRLFCSKN